MNSRFSFQNTLDGIGNCKRIPHKSRKMRCSSKLNKKMERQRFRETWMWSCKTNGDQYNEIMRSTGTRHKNTELQKQKILSNKWKSFHTNYDDKMTRVSHNNWPTSVLIIILHLYINILYFKFYTICLYRYVIDRWQ